MNAPKIRSKLKVTHLAPRPFIWRLYGMYRIRKMAKNHFIFYFQWEWIIFQSMPQTFVYSCWSSNKIINIIKTWVMRPKMALTHLAPRPILPRPTLLSCKDCLVVFLEIFLEEYTQTFAVILEDKVWQCFFLRIILEEFKIFGRISYKAYGGITGGFRM